MIKILFAIIFIANCFTQDINETAITVCKTLTGVKIGYLDSVKGIKEIIQRVENDTLVLTVRVSSIKNEEKEISLAKNIKYLRIGTKKIIISELRTCSKVYSGKEAIEQLNKLKD